MNRDVASYLRALLDLERSTLPRFSIAAAAPGGGIPTGDVTIRRGSDFCIAAPPATTCTLTLQGGHEGLHDRAGNAMPADHTISFRTNDDGALPTALFQPADGATAVPTNARVSVVFDAAMDPNRWPTPRPGLT